MLERGIGLATDSLVLLVARLNHARRLSDQLPGSVPEHALEGGARDGKPALLECRDAMWRRFEDLLLPVERMAQRFGRLALLRHVLVDAERSLARIRPIHRCNGNARPETTAVLAHKAKFVREGLASLQRGIKPVARLFVELVALVQHP